MLIFQTFWLVIYKIDADPDPAYQFDRDRDPTFQFDADPDPQH
jgi:hypothetical protein